MAFTVVPTVVTGDVATAAWGNTYLKNNFAATAVGVVTTAGDIVYATASQVLARLAIGTANQLLRVNAGATAPEWASTLSGLTLTSPTINGAALSGTLSGTPTVSGAVVFSGTPIYDNANAFSMKNSQFLTVALTAQTVADAVLTIPNFAGVADTFVFKTKAETLANKTLTAPVINGIVTTTGLTLPAFAAGGNITGGSGFTISTTTGALTLNPAAGLVITANAANSSWNVSSTGVARSIIHDIAVEPGGAANAVLQHAFHLGSVIEAGLLGETDGGGTYTQLKTVWKIPYADAGAGAVGPTAPTTAATWNGGLFLGTSNAVDKGRLYWYANEAVHYVEATAGFSYLYEEPTTFGNFNHDGLRPWQYGDLMVLKVDRYNENGGHALPYPLEEGLRETLLRLLDVDAEFRQQVKEKLRVGE